MARPLPHRQTQSYLKEQGHLTSEASLTDVPQEYLHQGFQNVVEIDTITNLASIKDAEDFFNNLSRMLSQDGCFISL
jgi:hypothetical protein